MVFFMVRIGNFYRSRVVSSKYQIGLCPLEFSKSVLMDAVLGAIDSESLSFEISGDMIKAQSFRKGMGMFTLWDPDLSGSTASE